MEDEESESNYRYLILLLSLATLVLAAATVYMMEVLGMSYGINHEIATILQNVTNLNATTTGALAMATQSVKLIHGAIEEVYLIFLISLGMLGASFVLYAGRPVKASSS